MADPYAPAPMTDSGAAWMDRTGGGPWWLVAAAGIGILLLADVVSFFDGGRHTAAAVFSLLGFVALVAGLALSALMATRWPWGARVALMLGAAFLAVGSFNGIP
ncbi:MAG TPA: hypothetical protein VHI93_09615 [Candidatus Thermoplasmatota archaeon]|nr:hypothetical protein [Candidatus Thermoplasmatota archaeon]